LIFFLVYENENAATEASFQDIPEILEKYLTVLHALPIGQVQQWQEHCRGPKSNNTYRLYPRMYAVQG
jgi:hypothetical protein